MSMKMTTIPQAKIETQYTKFGGGLDLTTPVLSISPGNALDAMNYEPGLTGGYKRIDGFERYDGRPSPSAASYTFLEGMPAAAIPLLSIVAGAASGATGVAVLADQVAGALALTKVSGTFQIGEQITVNGAVVGTLTMQPVARGYRDAKNDAIAIDNASDVYRADIGAVPGTGPVRGVWMYQGVLYAWRDFGVNLGMYQATSTGWQAVALGEEIAFTNANASVIEGAVLSQGTGGANTALIARVILQTGSLASAVNTGRLILKNRTGTTFASGAATTTGQGSGTLTLGGTQKAITLAAGGRVECISTNFAASTATYRMYGADGKNRAFEFDGSTYVPIATGMASDTPQFICEHKKKLFLTFNGSVQFSGDGLPYQWTVVVGAGELGMGDAVTGLAVQTGDTLAIFSRNSSAQLSGSTTNTFTQLPISKEIGALAYTVQTVGKTYGLDDRGVIVTDRTQSYGNFVQSTITQQVQPIIDQLRAKAIGSTVYRSRGQYRIYGNDGTGIILGFNTNGLLGVTQLRYPVNPTCFASCEDSTGKDVVFFGADNGYVYQADIGTSFDGVEIEAYLRMPFNNISSPRLRKRFRKAVMEMSAIGYCAVRFQPEFSYGDPDVGTHRLQVGEVSGSGGYWDVSLWDTFFYDARLVSTPQFSIEGTGTNMALLFYSSSTIDMGHTLQGMIIHFTPRRLER